MSSSLSPVRRLAVTIALTGFTAVGAITVAPAAMADDAAVVETAPAPESAPLIESVPAPESAPVTEPVESTEAVPAPEPESAPVIESAPVEEPAAATETEPAPETVAPTPPPVVYDKDGKPVKQPKVCTTEDLEKHDRKLAKATQKAGVLTRVAERLHDSADQLRAYAARARGASKWILNGLASAADRAADRLEDQAQRLVDKVGELKCSLVPTTPGGRF